MEPTTKLRREVRTHCVATGATLRDVAVILEWPYSRLSQKLGGFQTMTSDDEQRIREAVQLLAERKN